MTLRENEYTYDFIDRVFGTSNITDIEFNDTAMPNVTLDTFLRRVAHEKEIFIDSCQYAGKNCDIEADFDTVQTDMGICYTFNRQHNNSDPSTITQTGTGFGLSLILNLEQHEYMKGPHTDAGAQILLHDPSDHPLMKDLGFAVAPGAHTLVGVSRAEIHSMVHPYGKCVKDALPMSHCLRECRARQVIAQCGCNDDVIPNITLGEDGNPPRLCSLGLDFICTYRYVVYQPCKCDIPCKRTTYDPSLSYSYLAAYNIDRLVLTNNTKRKRVNASVLATSEFHLRRNRFKMNKEAQLVKTFAPRYRKFRRYYDLNKDTYLYNLKILRQLRDIPQAILDDRRIYTDFIDDLMRNITSIEDTVLDTQDKINTLLHWKNTCLYNDTIFVCDVTDALDLLDSMMNNTHVIRSFRYKYLGIPKLLDCFDILTDVYTSAQFSSINTLKSLLVNINGSAEETILFNEIFNQSSDKIYITRNDNNSHCVEYCNTNDSNETGRAIDQCQKCLLILLLDKTRECSLKLVNQILDIWPDFQFYAISDSSTTYYIDSDLDLFDNKAKALMIGINEEIIKHMNVYYAYRAGSLTKYEAASNWTSEDAFYLLHSWEVDQTHIHSLGSRIDGYLQNIISPLIPVYREVIDLTYSTIDWNSKSALLRLINNTSSDTGIATETHIITLLNSSCQRYYEAVDEILSILEYTEETVPELSEYLYGLQDRFKSYLDSVTINEAFFMKNFLRVDIFYKELSEEKIQQHEAFPFLSLLSEVGGFLGLLLGASVLTVCELLDFVIMTCIKRCRSRTSVLTSMKTSMKASKKVYSMRKNNNGIV